MLKMVDIHYKRFRDKRFSLCTLRISEHRHNQNAPFPRQKQKSQTAFNITFSTKDSSRDTSFFQFSVNTEVVLNS